MNLQLRAKVRKVGMEILYSTPSTGFVRQYKGGKGCLLEQIADAVGVSSWVALSEGNGPLTAAERNVLYLLNDRLVTNPHDNFLYIALRHCVESL